MNMKNKQQIVIMEGADMMGKSTIAEALSKKLSVPIVKIKRHEKWFDPMIDLIYAGETHCQLAEQTGYSFIYDRLFPSEYAYSRAYGRATSHDKILSIDERYAAMGAVVVVCYKNAKAYQEDDKGIIDVAKYTQLTDWFKEFKKISKCKVLMLDTTDENLEAQLDAIIKELDK
jgi:thymidylate kinase